MAKKILTTFKGLNNTSDPLELGNSWLTSAVNLNITNAGRLSTREGLVPVASGAFSGAYGTKGAERMFVVRGGVLEERDAASGAFRPLVDGLSTAPMRWAEINKQIFFNNGVDAGVISGGAVLPLKFDAPPPPRVEVGSGSLDAGLYRACCTFLLPDGRETGSGDVVEVDVHQGGSLIFSEIPQAQGALSCVYVAPANSTVFQLAFEGAGPAATWSLPATRLGVELRTFALSGLPDGAEEIAFWRGCLYASMFSPADGVSVVWRSKPLQFHLFDLWTDCVVTVQGRINQLIETDGALVIGMDWQDGNKIYAYQSGADGDTLTELANYGTVDGQNAVADDDGNAVFLTCRGPARAMPYELLSPQVSFPPGLSAGGGFVERDGDKRYVVSLQPGGSPWNVWRGR